MLNVYIFYCRKGLQHFSPEYLPEQHCRFRLSPHHRHHNHLPYPATPFKLFALPIITNPPYCTIIQVIHDFIGCF